ncbi:dephospho-CoA kinase [Mycoplasma sp. P36-A1]|uniref:dephospho-CoA kinase n=1 Tax=Mycoplasma sp. P36-A1 TaxID=3252900 RepID=UPI003C3097EA
MSKLSKKIIIGLTGNIASGKSSASSYLKIKGYQIIDTDLITQQLYDYNAVFKKEIVKIFTENIIVDNKIDKNKISQIVFDDKEKLKQLEEVAHNMIFDKSMELVRESKNKLIIFDVPLLFESNFNKICDKVIFIYIDEEIQLKRLLLRNNYDLNYAKKRIYALQPQEIKVKKADFIIDNSTNLENLYRQLDSVMKNIKEEYKIC